MKDLDKEQTLLLAKHKQIHHNGFCYNLKFLFIGFICLNYINMMTYFLKKTTYNKNQLGENRDLSHIINHTFNAQELKLNILLLVSINCSKRIYNTTQHNILKFIQINHEVQDRSGLVK
jgi:hypothetical protein